jgi:sigma-B regulation protein RsbU (phosphoserine phosphatase)
MPTLYIYPKSGDSFTISLGTEKVTIGRSADNMIFIPDPFCSSHHAVIYPTATGFAVKDAGSKNGTFVNGKKIAGEFELKKGDEVLVGSVRVIFDKAILTNVEVTDQLSSTTNVNTIIPFREILKKPPTKTTIRAFPPLGDIETIRAEHKISSIISEVSQALILHKPISELLDHIMNIISEHLPMDRSILMLKEGNPVQLIPRVIRIDNKRFQNQKIQVSKSIVNMAFEQQLSVLTSDAALDPRFSAKDSIINSGIHSAMCVPLWDETEIIGVIYADRISQLEAFTDEELRLLTLLSNLAAVKIGESRRIEREIETEKMKRELQLAAQTQSNFLPKENPSCENYEIAGKNIPCHEVGGDYYDFISIDPCHLGISIADVSGKGVSASLLMASLRANLHAMVHVGYDLGAMVVKLNDFVHLSSDINVFITFFFCELDKKTGELRYINAGHNPPFVIKKTGEVGYLDSSGLCLGMLPSVTYDLKTMAIDPGDILLLYTDGITESRNKVNEEFGVERLTAIIRKHGKVSAFNLAQTILKELDDFTAKADPADDRTLVVVKRTA